MKPRKPLRRYTPLPRRRLKPRRGQPTPAEKRALRVQRYAMAHGRCELRMHADCLGQHLPWAGHVFVRAHLVHLRGRVRGGWDIENLRIGCYLCHIIEMHTKRRKPNAE